MDQLPPVVSQPISPPRTSSPGSASTVQPKPDGVKYSRPLVLGILFGVTGALGLPLLWASPVFSPKEKIWWTIVNTIYTLVLVGIAAAALIVIRNAFVELQN